MSSVKNIVKVMNFHSLIRVDKAKKKATANRNVKYRLKKKQYASVLIEGTGNYTGRAELKFTIVGMAHVTTTWDEVLEIFGYKRYDGIAVPTL